MIFREYWISRSRCNIWCSVRAQGSHEKTSVMVCTGLHWISLPSMDLVQLIVQKKWNGRKRSERWSGQNLSNPHFFKISISAQRSFFFEGPKVSKGKRLETVGDRTFARPKKTCFYIILHKREKRVKRLWKSRENMVLDVFHNFQ